MFGSIFYALLLAFTGILSAIFAMAGLGAANTLIPIYTSLGIAFSVAAASGLLLNVFSLSTATINNWRNKHINWKVGTTFMVPAVIMAPIGALIGTHSPRRILLIIFSIFLVYTLYNFIKTRKGSSGKLLSGTKGTTIGVVIGGFAGFIGGLLGVGGGMIVLPVMTFLEQDYKTVSGTTGYVALFSSASGFLSYLTILHEVNYVIWEIVLAGGILGGLTGSYFINRFTSHTIKMIIILIVAAVTVKLVYSLIV